MSFTPPVIKDGFAYANDSFYAEASNQNRHRRATVSELDTIFHPPARRATGTVDKDPAGNWYEAQLLHYGLRQSKSKAVAKTRLLEALNKGGLAVPAHIQKIETELKKEWLKRDRAAKKQAQSHNASSTEAAAQKSASRAKADESSDRKGKRKRTEGGDETNKTSKQTVKVGNVAVKAQKAKSESSMTPSATKTTAIYRGPPRGGASTRGRASATSGRSIGSGLTRGNGEIGNPSRATSSPQVTRPKQTARRSRGTLRGRGGSFTTRPQNELSPSFFGMPDTASALDWGGYGDSDREASADSNGMECNEESSGDAAPELLPLGLLNGIYQVQSEDLDGNSIWGEYDFGMHSGIMYLPGRPWSSSYEPVPFSWRGRENSEDTISFGPTNRGWIRFLGGGKIEGMINCYGEKSFTGRRISGNETKAPRDARSMRAEWEGYNSDEYERARRARWGGGGW